MNSYQTSPSTRRQTSPLRFMLTCWTAADETAHFNFKFKHAKKLKYKQNQPLHEQVNSLQSCQGFGERLYFPKCNLRQLWNYSSASKSWVSRGEVSKIHPQVNMNICTKNYGNPSNSYWDISVWSKVADHLMDTFIHRAESMTKISHHISTDAWLHLYPLISP